MRWTRTIAVFAAVGAFLGIVGPYGTASEHALPRLIFWLLLVPVGGMICFVLDRQLRDRLGRPALRIPVTAAAATLPIVALTLAGMFIILGHRHAVLSPVTGNLLWQVFVINLGVLVLLWLAERAGRELVEVRAVFAAPIPDEEAPFRMRLSARRRSAKLVALEAHDHFVRVHTDAGSELLSVRFSDAVKELEGVNGFRIHRSWWVSGAAIERAIWRRGSGRVELETGVVAPVSRSGAPVLREAGWL